MVQDTSTDALQPSETYHPASLDGDCNAAAIARRMNALTALWHQETPEKNPPLLDDASNASSQNSQGNPGMPGKLDAPDVNHDTVPDRAKAFEDLIVRLHRSNFDLWHYEDRARDTTSTDAEIAAVKRSIDRVNQLRNDLAERIDRALLASLAQQSLPHADAPLHSETPGQMLDRISILSLKLFHTSEEVERPDATEPHRHRNRARLSVLREQQNDLAACLASLWTEILAGSRRFKLYRQFKMYNDPDLNPILYRAAPESSL